jgi:hypothetical protein
MLKKFLTEVRHVVVGSAAASTTSPVPAWWSQLIGFVLVFGRYYRQTVHFGWPKKSFFVSDFVNIDHIVE